VHPCDRAGREPSRGALVVGAVRVARVRSAPARAASRSECREPCV